MARDEHANDILIGNDKWIKWIDINEKQFAHATQIDPIILRVKDFWDRLEYRCVAECCGIDAFDFCPESIGDAGLALGLDQTACEINRITAEIKALDSEILVSKRLNNYFHKTMFLQLLEHIACSLKG